MRQYTSPVSAPRPVHLAVTAVGDDESTTLPACDPWAACVVSQVNVSPAPTTIAFQASPDPASDVLTVEPEVPPSKLLERRSAISPPAGMRQSARLAASR